MLPSWSPASTSARVRGKLLAFGRALNVGAVPMAHALRNPVNYLLHFTGRAATFYFMHYLPYSWFGGIKVRAASLVSANRVANCFARCWRRACCLRWCRCWCSASCSRR